ncbi:hypothetical protein RHGRI_037520 [Rhododendron griersonianum]|uniref:Cotton fiber protein n=1 Tax=Rhododendron griersonianum TaxID=479676 RepID=A0AAV6HRZ1_9ERIC|nr:hypothetical protein RHGRI_037520 [Rhododendron griersonianum]
MNEKRYYMVYRSPPSPSSPRSLQPFFGFPSSQFGASVALVRRDSPLRWLCTATGGDPQPVVQHGGSRSVMLETGGVVIRSGGLGGGLRNKVVRVCWVVGVKAAGVVGCVGGASWGFPTAVAVAPRLGCSGSSLDPVCAPAFSSLFWADNGRSGGRSLRVAKPKRQETLETTWKAITDGRHVPLTRHLRKSDTWENHGRQFNTTTDHSPPPQIVLKSETLRDRTNYNPQPSNPSPGSSKLRKEASLSQDELNRRVEAFIKKFNDEMRLQRQESMNQYMEMINRGAH